MFQPAIANKLGINIKPNWRYEALLYPGKYKLTQYLSKVKDTGGCLKRYIGAGLLYELHENPPDEIALFLTQLPRDKANELRSLWKRSLKRNNVKKLKVDFSESVLKNNPIWNLKKIEGLNDTFLRRAIKHVSNYEYDHYIGQAFSLFQSPEYEEIVKFIGYCLYAKISDKEVAKRWQLPIKTIEALRLLFFDFSKFPKDRVANFTFLRQLANNGTISDIDFSYYKRVFELGELGLKAQTDFSSLTKEEREVVEEYLGKTVISNTFNLQFSIRNQKDALAYGSVISTLGNYYIKQAETNYFIAKTKNVIAVTKRIEGESTATNENMTTLDKEMMALLKENSLQEIKVEYKTLSDLKNKD